MDSIIEAIQTLVKASVATSGSPLQGIKKVYFGDPITIPASSLPAITIQPENTQFTRRGSRVDQKNHRIKISIVYNQRTYYGKDGADAEKVDVITEVIQMMEKTDDNHDTAGTSVCGIIQKNPNLQLNGLNTSEDAKVADVEYLFSERRGFATFEVVATIEATTIGDR